MTKRPAAKAKRGRVKAWAFVVQSSTLRIAAFPNRETARQTRISQLTWNKEVNAEAYRCGPIVKITLPAPGKGRRP